MRAILIAVLAAVDCVGWSRCETQQASWRKSKLRSKKLQDVSISAGKDTCLNLQKDMKEVTALKGRPSPTTTSPDMWATP